MLFKYGLLLLSYLLGAIPFSVVMGKKFKNIDIRERGSGNPGGTNALRHLGKNIGIPIIFLDALKGGIIILLIRFNVFGSIELLHPLAYGVAAAVGHVFSIFIRFKGGKAVAATVGMVIAYNLPWALIMFAGFMLTLKFSRFVSLASTAAGILFFVSSLVWGDFEAVPYTAAIMILILFRHIENYKRIYNKVEPPSSFLQKKDG